MQDLKLALLQSEIFWEDIDKNLELFENHINDLDGDCDIIVLPEVFQTGFPVDPLKFAEEINGRSHRWMQRMAKEKDAVICASILLKEEDKYYNCLIWQLPDGRFDTYAKRHVFHLGLEAETITPGNKHLVVEYKGWKIRPLVCYDLRFPVWSKNTYSEGKFEYDLLIYVANWPKQRSFPWSLLLKARAMENLAYVCGVNRIGQDGLDNSYSGDSAVLDCQGVELSSIKPELSAKEIVTIKYQDLLDFRTDFNVGLDWDEFKIMT